MVMKRKLLFLVILVALVVGVALLVKTLTNRGPKQGELRVDSTPAATIFIDNKNIGRTPFPSGKVDAGIYDMKLVPDSGSVQLAPWEGEVTIGQNLLTYVNADLSDSELSSAVDVLWLEKISSSNSELSVTTSPDGATVMVDNATKGVTPLTVADVTPGDHTVTVTSVGFLTRTLQIKMTAGYRLIVTMKLGLSPGTGAPQTATPSASLSGTLIGSSSSASATSSANLPNPPKPFLTVKDTPTGFLRVRMDPNTAATEAARINPGDKFHIEDTQNGWDEIKYDGTNLGWVSGQYVNTTQ